MRMIDLRTEEEYLTQYIELRNMYCDLLVTGRVDLKGTKEWLEKSEAVIRGMAENGILAGFIILYLNRDAEVAFATREHSRGIGTAMIHDIEDVARTMDLDHIWGWALLHNIGAQRLFIKNGFIEKERSERLFNGEKVTGIVFVKYLRG